MALSLALSSSPVKVNKSTISNLQGFREAIAESAKFLFEVFCMFWGNDANFQLAKPDYFAE